MTSIDLTKGIYRKVYAGFISGRRINAVTLPAEAWFWRIQAIADDFGNLPADPALLWANTRGRRQNVTLEQVNDWVAELVREKLIVPYHADDADFYHIDGFEALQATRNGKPRHKYPAFNGVCSKADPESIQAASSAPRSMTITKTMTNPSPSAPEAGGGDSGKGASLNSGRDRGAGQGDAMVRYMLSSALFKHVKPPAKDRIPENLIDDMAARRTSTPVRVWRALDLAAARSEPGHPKRIDDPVGWLVVVLTGSKILQVNEADERDFAQSDVARAWAAQDRVTTQRTSRLITDAARLREGAKA